jgi:hypothetical protein
MVFMAAAAIFNPTLGAMYHRAVEKSRASARSGDRDREKLRQTAITALISAVRGRTSQVSILEHLNTDVAHACAPDWSDPAYLRGWCNDFINAAVCHFSVKHVSTATYNQSLTEQIQAIFRAGNVFITN